MVNPRLQQTTNFVTSFLIFERNKVWYFIGIVCQQTILMKYHAVFEIFEKKAAKFEIVVCCKLWATLYGLSLFVVCCQWSLCMVCIFRGFWLQNIYFKDHLLGFFKVVIISIFKILSKVSADDFFKFWCFFKNNKWDLTFHITWNVKSYFFPEMKKNITKFVIYCSCENVIWCM